MPASSRSGAMELRAVEEGMASERWEGGEMGPRFAEGCGRRERAEMNGSIPLYEAGESGSSATVERAPTERGLRSSLNVVVGMGLR